MGGTMTNGRRALAVAEARTAPGLAARLRRTVLGISESAVLPERRGHRSFDDPRRRRAIRVGRSFLAGYHAALLDPRPEALARAVSSDVETGWRGFAWEGVGMSLALQDAFRPGRSRRLHEILSGPGHPHRYLVIVGAGWSFARLPRRFDRALAGLDPVLRWLAFDGYGFHHGYFGWRRSVERHRVPRRLRGYARHAFDQGLGRSLWFVRGMDPASLATTVARFPAERRSDLWSGVGLASAFAGGLGPDGLRELRRRAGDALPHLAQGVAFAAKARLEAGEGTPWLEEASRVLTGASAAELAAVTDRALSDLPPDDLGDPERGVPAFEVWRRRIRREIAR